MYSENRVDRWIFHSTPQRKSLITLLAPQRQSVRDRLYGHIAPPQTIGVHLNVDAKSTAFNTHKIGGNLATGFVNLHKSVNFQHFPHAQIVSH